MDRKVGGSTENIRDATLEEMAGWIGYRMDPGVLLDEDLAGFLAGMTARLGREIAVLVSRGGRVETIRVGNAREVVLGTPVRDTDGRPPRRRCIHTHPDAPAAVSELDLGALEALGLDSMTALGVDREGRITQICTARPGPDGSPRIETYPGLDSLPPPEAPAPGPRGGRTRSCLPPEERALLVGVSPAAPGEEALPELRELARSAGVRVLDAWVQNRDRPSPRTYLGRGRLAEAARQIQTLGANLLITDDELSVAQQRNLEEALGIRVIDRTALILDIFASRARSSEGKIQVELAQLEYRLPRLSGRGTELSRLGGGIGTRGPGETQLEVDRRRIRRRIHVLRRELDRAVAHRRTQRKARESLYHVALVGYTNAGKTTLLNALSQAALPAEDRLFATLDSVTRRVGTPGGFSFLLSDTVGFIRKLPHPLVAAFRATLEETAQADLLLHVADGADPDCEGQVAAVCGVLSELDLTDRPQLLVLNKADRLDPGRKRDLGLQWPAARLISARTGEGLPGLLEAIGTQSVRRRVPVSCCIPFSRGDLADAVFRVLRDGSIEHRPEGYRVRGMLPADLAERLRRAGIAPEGEVPDEA